MGLHLPALEEDEMLYRINYYNSFKDVSSKAGIPNQFCQIKKIGSLKKRTEIILTFNNILSKKLIILIVKNVII